MHRHKEINKMATSDKFRFIAGRTCVPAPVGIGLVFVNSRLDEITARVSNCNDNQRPSYNFAVEDCKVKELVERGDTSYAIPFGACYTPTPENCPVLPACFNGVYSTVISGLSATANPNCKVITIAVSQPRTFTNDCKICNDCLAKLIADLLTQYGIANTPQTVFAVNNAEYDICPLLKCVQKQLDAPAVTPIIPPELLLLCSTISEFPDVSLAKVFGKDASGNCGWGVSTAVTQTPLVVVDSSTIDFTASGVDNHTISAVVKVSARAGNTLAIQAEGLYVPTPVTTAPIVKAEIDLSIPTSPKFVITVDGVAATTPLPMIVLNDSFNNTQLGYIFA
jgi:hypothetical protein